MTNRAFNFHGVGEHDFRPRDSDNDDWLECVYCGTAVVREGEGMIGAMFNCYQEQLFRRDPEGEHSGPVPRSPFTS